MQGLVGQGQGKESGLHSNIRKANGWGCPGRKRKKRMMCGDQTIRFQL